MIRLLLILFLSYSTCFSQTDKFYFREGIESFKYLGNVIVESRFTTFDSKVSDEIIIYLFKNFKYLGENSWKTNDTITQYFKEGNEYIFVIKRNE